MKYVLLALLVGCANDPQYVECGATDTMDSCLLDSADAVMMGTGKDAFMAVKGSLHVPVMPLDADLMKAQADLQKTLPDGVDAPMYRLDQYDISVDYILKNLDEKPSTVKIQLNVANEQFSWDPSMIMPAGDESPPAPGLQGDIPIDIQPHGEIDSLFREDQLLEAAIDLDQISRGNINMYAATLTVNKNDDSFQPLSAVMPPPAGSNDPPMQSPTGPAVPRSAFRNVVRVDVVLKPDDQHTQVQFNIRLRPHVDKVIHDMGMNAPAAELTILDPAPFVPAYTP